MIPNMFCTWSFQRAWRDVKSSLYSAIQTFITTCHEIVFAYNWLHWDMFCSDMDSRSHCPRPFLSWYKVMHAGSHSRYRDGEHENDAVWIEHHRCFDVYDCDVVHWVRFLCWSLIWAHVYIFIVSVRCWKMWICLHSCHAKALQYYCTIPFVVSKRLP